MLLLFVQKAEAEPLGDAVHWILTAVIIEKVCGSKQAECFKDEIKFLKNDLS